MHRNGGGQKDGTTFSPFRERIYANNARVNLGDPKALLFGPLSLSALNQFEEGVGFA